MQIVGLTGPGDRKNVFKQPPFFFNLTDKFQTIYGLFNVVRPFKPSPAVVLAILFAYRWLHDLGAKLLVPA